MVIEKKNEETLMRILSDNAGTDFGKKYGFSEISGVDDYRRVVPLSDYSAYKKPVADMLDGKTETVTAYDVIGYCHTSGTTTQSEKVFPVTRQEMEVYGGDLTSYVDKYIKKHGGKRLITQLFRTDPGVKDDEPILISEQIYKYIAEEGMLDFESYTGGRDILFDPHSEDASFIKCFAALLDEDIAVMEATFMYDHVHFFTYLEKNYRMIIDSIKTGIFPDDIHVSERVKNALINLEKSDERIAYIEKTCEEGFEGIAKKLWPRLGLMAGISSRAFFSENELLRRYAGDISFYYSYFLSTECYIADCVAEGDYNFSLCLGHSFFEFLPYEGQVSAGTLLPNEVMPGHVYEIVVTNFAGLYRYRMGDIVRIIKKTEDRLVFEFIKRRGVAISIAGERLGLTQIEQAVKALVKTGTDIEMYCFAPRVDTDSAGYRVLISYPEDAISEEELSIRLDEELKKVNSGYEDLRNMKHLTKPDVWICNPSKYFDIMKENGLMDGHKKPKHVAKRGFEKWREL